MRLVLHIGAWKTGSTAIQRFLGEHGDALAARGVLVAPMVRARGDVQNGFTRLVGADDAAADEFLDQLKAMEAAHPGGVGVVSSEHFWPLPEERVALVARRLRRIAEEVRVLLYVRPQDELWASLYQQQAKNLHVTAAMARWGDDAFVSADIAGRAIFFDRALAPYREAFGAGAVHARLYRRAALAGGDAAQDFVAFVGGGDVADLRRDAADRNPSLGWKGLSTALWFAEACLPALGPGDIARRHRIGRATTRAYKEAAREFGDEDWIGRPAGLFDAAERRAIRAAYAEDNARLFARQFGGEDVFGPVSDRPKTPLGLESVPGEELDFVRGRLGPLLRKRGIDPAPIQRLLASRSAGGGGGGFPRPPNSASRGRRAKRGLETGRMKIVLHIGAWKTGSSAIQFFLRRNMAALRDRGVLVPTMANQTMGHQKVFDALTKGPDSAARAYLDEMKALAAGRPDATAVISSEHFWPIRADTIDHLAAQLREVSDDIRVLLYVRPQDEMWASLYAQEAKFFRIRTGTARWGTNEFVGGDITDRALKYDYCLSFFRERFGDDRVIAKLYDREAFAGGNVIVDFLRFLGVENDEGLHFDRFDRNPSFGWKAVAFSIWFTDRLIEPLLAANDGKRVPIRQAFTATISDVRKRLDDRDWLGKAAEIFDAEERREIRAAYAEDNRALFGRYFGGRDAFGPVRDSVKSPLDIAAVPAAEARLARTRLLINLWRAGLNTAPVEASLVETPRRRALVGLIERSPIGWLERRARPRVQDL